MLPREPAAHTRRRGRAWATLRAVSMPSVIGAAMRSTGEYGAFFATHQIHKDGKWLANPYAFDQATRAAMTVFNAHRPPGKITVPSPTVHDVVGGDPKESAERFHYLLTELGPLIAEREIKSREQSDE